MDRQRRERGVDRAVAQREPFRRAPHRRRGGRGALPHHLPRRLDGEQVRSAGSYDPVPAHTFTTDRADPSASPIRLAIRGSGRRYPAYPVPMRS